MELDAEALTRLSTLELEMYAGKLSALAGEDMKKATRLKQLPVRVKLVAERGVCEDSLYDICSEVEGQHASFHELRMRVIGKLARDLNSPSSPAWNLLPVLFDGIYVGEPEDLLGFRKGRSEPLYPTKGLGTKLADIEFIS